MGQRGRIDERPNLQRTRLLLPTRRILVTFLGQAVTKMGMIFLNDFATGTQNCYHRCRKSSLRAACDSRNEVFFR
jgi:hypothetical protein